MNTGWSGGGYGTGQRMKIEYTRALLKAALDGSLNKVSYTRDPVFGLQLPERCPDVPQEILNPRNTWKDKEAFDRQAQHLANLFVENFQQFADQSPEEIKSAGPKVSDKV